MRYNYAQKYYASRICKDYIRDYLLTEVLRNYCIFLAFQHSLLVMLLSFALQKPLWYVVFTVLNVKFNEMDKSLNRYWLF